MTVLIVAPHPDDETIGCGGTLLKHRAAGEVLHWLIFTEMDSSLGYSEERIAAREKEIQSVARRFDFESVTRLGHPTARLDRVSMGDMIGQVADVIREVAPSMLYLPFPGDAHSDHRTVHDCVTACTKWFRAPSVRRILAYETVSETDITMRLGGPHFSPNVYEDISTYLDDKVATVKLFEGEWGVAPFPRSEEIVRAKAAVRGAEAGFSAAEAFMLVKEIRP